MELIQLEPSTLRSLLELKYGSIHDAVQELVAPNEIGEVFCGFQKYLYAKLEA